MLRTHRLVLAIYFATGAIAQATETATPEPSGSAPQASVVQETPSTVPVDVATSANAETNIDTAAGNLKAFGWTQTETSPTSSAEPAAAATTTVPIPAAESTVVTDDATAANAATDTTTAVTADTATDQTISTPPDEIQVQATAPSPSAPEFAPSQPEPDGSAAVITATPAQTIVVAPAAADLISATPNAATPLPPNVVVTENAGP